MFREVKLFSPYLFILKMHRFLWRIHICMQSMKKTIDPRQHNFTSSSGSPIGRVQFFSARRSLHPLCSACRPDHSDPPPPLQPHYGWSGGGLGGFAEMDIRDPPPPGRKQIFGIPKYVASASHLMQQNDTTTPPVANQTPWQLRRGQHSNSTISTHPSCTTQP